MQNVKAVLFDMDGVLINTEPLHYRMWKETFKRRGLEIDFDGYKDCIGATHNFLMDLILKNYGVDFREDKKIRDEAMEIKKQMIAKEGFPRMAGTKEMLQKLYEAGFYLAIASSSPISFIEFAMDYIGARQYFHLMNSGDNVKHSKPAPDIYLDTAKRLGVEPARCVVLEDSRNGVAAAVAAGMTCVGLFNPDSGMQDLSRADRIIQSLPEFTPELIRGL